MVILTGGLTKTRTYDNLICQSVLYLVTGTVPYVARVKQNGTKKNFSFVL